MLVHAKTPLIEVQVIGRGSRHVVALIRRAYPAATVTDDNGSIDITQTDWYRKISSKMTPGKALRSYRDNAGLTLAQLSVKAGIAAPHLSAMENDKRGIGRATAMKLGKALKCEYQRFL